MQELGLSASELAEKAGLDPTTVRAVITGRRWPQTSTRAKLAAALDWQFGDVAAAAPAQRLDLSHTPTADLVQELCGRLDQGQLAP